MYVIKHLITIDCPINEVYQAVDTIEGLRSWWTIQTERADEDHIDFRFGDRYYVQMRVIEQHKDNFIKWECIEAEPDWIGTELSFHFSLEDGKTVLRFMHDKWPSNADFYAHCNLSWGKYLLSLKDYLEMGLGRPFKPENQY